MGAERPGVNGNMKEGIHPEYVECQVACACGESFTTRATKPELRVDICSECHPFFSGQQKMVDTEGRVEQFIRRYGSCHPIVTHPQARAASAWACCCRGYLAR